jgi:AcrR family transcriptional regulator
LDAVEVDPQDGLGRRAVRGYQAATVDEIARRSGVSAPIVYDHFESKADLHARLLERHLSQMREVWRDNLTGDESPDVRIARALDAWFAYVESHPYAWRMIFRDTTATPTSRRPTGGSRRSRAPGCCRSAIAGLALWWYDHREVPREQVVAAAMNALWIGLERLGAGGRWEP